MIIKLVRHGESQANVGGVNPQQTGDYTVGLTPRGIEQARLAGAQLGRAFVDGSLVYTSPYHRARETLAAVLAGAGLERGHVHVYEDPRLREMDHGYTDTLPQQALRKTFGWFYYRYAGGESPADCYDRTSSFLEGMMRQVAHKGIERVLIVTHGMTIRCFVMRFLHLSVEQFEQMKNPENGDIITLAPCAALPEAQFQTTKWSVAGLRL